MTPDTFHSITIRPVHRPSNQKYRYHDYVYDIQQGQERIISMHHNSNTTTPHFRIYSHHFRSKIVSTHGDNTLMIQNTILPLHHTTTLNDGDFITIFSTTHFPLPTDKLVYQFRLDGGKRFTPMRL